MSRLKVGLGSVSNFGAEGGRPPTAAPCSATVWSSNSFNIFSQSGQLVGVLKLHPAFEHVNGVGAILGTDQEANLLDNFCREHQQVLKRTMKMSLKEAIG